MKLVWYGTISDVREKSLTVSGKKAADGSAELTTESAGWWIYIGHISLYAGDTKPEFEKGDHVRISLQHAKQEKSE